MKKIDTTKAPKAVGPYSQAIVAGDMVFCSGQIGLDPQTGQLVKGGIVAEAKQALNNLKEVLKAEKLDFTSVTMVNVYLKNMGDFAAMNEVYGQAFSKEPYPARVTVGVSELPKSALVEISCIAVKK